MDTHFLIAALRAAANELNEQALNISLNGGDWRDDSGVIYRNLSDTIGFLEDLQVQVDKV